jgi:hypothetical protein
VKTTRFTHHGAERSRAIAFRIATPARGDIISTG